MNTLDDIAREQAVPAADEEEKKRKKKRNLLVGLAALAVIGGSAVCLSTGIVDKLRPVPEPTEAATVVVEPTAYAPLPAATAVTLSPTPTTPVEAYDVREAWYGDYEGTAAGRKDDAGRIDEFFEGNDVLWLEIMNEDDCFGSGYCNEDRSWGVDINYVGNYIGHSSLGNGIVLRIYLPENLSDAPSLTITDNMLRITSTEEHPYELTLNQVGGNVEGNLEAYVPSVMGGGIDRWTIDHLIVNLGQ